ncbi:hypothetical protein NS365_04085 [Aureimonas ureilytica]|uniref:Transmembrane protein n=1 Tax=Aureimonas ureilytica TaxID=401562 RepID=A0A175RVC2_9HYPH|nr:hypothetical protein [Aureimonas ureilytica]KTR07477.1 hypothetical protein NS365_04085 [Aureimonas ureilytica]
MVIVVQLARHFSVRRFEWFMALALLWIGWALYQPADTFARSPSYDIMARWASEETWAYLLMGTGFVRIVVLVINGVVLRRCAEIRAALGVWSFSIAMMMAIGFHSAPVEGSVIAYLLTLMALFELSNVWTAFLDAHDRRMARQHAHDTR